MLILSLLTGCATQTIAPREPNSVIVVPGVGGDGPPYAQVLHSLKSHGSDDCLCVSDWGSSWPVFLVSVSSPQWHEAAEQNLADLITARWRSNPGSRIVLIAHSAGAGVTMGALARLEPGIVTGPVILLAPDLSPDFDLRPALKHAQAVHVFYSPRDDFFQGIGPELVGTYDGAHREAAGRDGFSLASLNIFERSRVIQHRYENDWSALGNEGGHYDWLTENFVAVVIKPIIDADITQSFAASLK